MPSLSQRLRQKPVDAELDRWVPRSQDDVPLHWAQLEDAELLERQGETRL